MNGKDFEWRKGRGGVEVENLCDDIEREKEGIYIFRGRDT